MSIWKFNVKSLPLAPMGVNILYVICILCHYCDCLMNDLWAWKVHSPIIVNDLLRSMGAKCLELLYSKIVEEYHYRDVLVNK